MRWDKRFDGSIESLKDKSYRPLSKHPNSHTDTEIYWIKNLIRRNPNISLIELYAKLKLNKGYTRHPCSLFRFLRKFGFFKDVKQPSKPYHTPTKIGVKMQVDVKYVPNSCYVRKYPDKFYQYTIIDEATRERFIYPFKEQSSYSEDQVVQMKKYLYKSNRLPMQTLNWLSPIEKRKELLELKEN